MHKRIYARNLADGFNVKRSPCVCGHNSGTGWENGWHLWYFTISDEDLTLMCD